MNEIKSADDKNELEALGQRTVHTSAKACLTRAAIWRISMSSRFMSVNYFPYLPIVTNSENYACIHTVIGSPLKFNHLFIGPLPTFPENFMQIFFRSFCAKLLTDLHNLLGESKNIMIFISAS